MSESIKENSRIDFATAYRLATNLVVELKSDEYSSWELMHLRDNIIQQLTHPDFITCTHITVIQDPETGEIYCDECGDVIGQAHDLDMYDILESQEGN